MVLWLLILRGLAIELRHQVHSPMWTDFWDVVFSAASLLLALLFGVALGNVLRGLPLNAEGYFFLPLWTNLSPTAPRLGIIDWYTALIGLLAVAVLVMHGGHFLSFKTGGAIAERASHGLDAILLGGGRAHALRRHRHAADPAAGRAAILDASHRLRPAHRRASPPWWRST